MTPDALMIYCSSSLDSLDTQMNTIFQQQQQANAFQNVVADAATALQGYQSNGIGSSGHPDNAKCQALEKQLYADYQKASAIDPNSPVTAGLAKIYNEVMASGSGPFQDSSGSYAFIGSAPTTGHTEQDGVIDPDEMAGYVSEVQSVSSGINSSSQLSMINLQSLMSQQQTAVQLTTNLVQTLDDSLQKVVENIGH